MKKAKFIGMMVKLTIQPFLLFFLMLIISSCAHVISKDLRDKVDPTLTFKQVHQNPNAYKGRFAMWGGEIIETLNQKGGTTLIEVFQRPLGRRGGPIATAASDGRFLVLAEKYLDPYLFRRGRKITVAGEILGEKIKPLGEMDYRYPLLSSKQIFLWGYFYYRPYPFYYYPWWYYDPWWGYPYGWRLNFYHNRHF